MPRVTTKVVHTTVLTTTKVTKEKKMYSFKLWVNANVLLLNYLYFSKLLLVLYTQYSPTVATVVTVTVVAFDYYVLLWNYNTLLKK